MTGAGDAEDTLGQLKAREEHGNEGTPAEVVVKDAVGFLKDLFGRPGDGRHGADDGTCFDHKQRARKALSGGISDHDAERIGVELDEVVEVASDRSGR